MNKEEIISRIEGDLCKITKVKPLFELVKSRDQQWLSKHIDEMNPTFIQNYLNRRSEPMLYNSVKYLFKFLTDDELKSYADNLLCILDNDATIKYLKMMQALFKLVDHKSDIDYVINWITTGENKEPKGLVRLFASCIYKSINPIMDVYHFGIGSVIFTFSYKLSKMNMHIDKSYMKKLNLSDKMLYLANYFPGDPDAQIIFDYFYMIPNAPDCPPI